MRVLAGVTLVLAANLALAQHTPSFSEYKVSTEVAADLASRCRVEIQQEYGQRCERFYNHMEKHMELHAQFSNRLANEGDSAYGNADAVDLEMYRRTLSHLSENMLYINTMSELQIGAE